MEVPVNGEDAQSGDGQSIFGYPFSGYYMDVFSISIYKPGDMGRAGFYQNSVALFLSRPPVRAIMFEFV